MTRRHVARSGSLVALLAALVVVAAACAQPMSSPSSATPVPTSAVSAVPSGLATPGGSVALDPDSGLPLVDPSTLPPETTETMGLIGVGGPFPYPQDGAVFENREGILPDADIGYYHEYTVETPGSADRGARRIVVGNQGEAYWTDDHYASFSRIAP